MQTYEASQGRRHWRNTEPLVSEIDSIPDCYTTVQCQHTRIKMRKGKGTRPRLAGEPDCTDKIRGSQNPSRTPDVESDTPRLYSETNASYRPDADTQSTRPTIITYAYVPFIWRHLCCICLDRPQPCRTLFHISCIFLLAEALPTGRNSRICFVHIPSKSIGKRNNFHRKPIRLVAKALAAWLHPLMLVFLATKHAVDWHFLWLQTHKIASRNQIRLAEFLEHRPGDAVIGMRLPRIPEFLMHRNHIR
ncbi:hypothetical protein V8C26DRAFT_387386 [Trichoderma gracile]